MEWCRVEGGMGSSAHSPELVVAHVLVVTHVPVVTRVLIVTRVLVVTRVFVAREPRWPFWLVVVRARRGSWGMVVVAACGQWILAGDRSRAVGGRRGCRLCRSLGAGRPLGAAVAGCGLWLAVVIIGWEGRLWVGWSFSWAVVSWAVGVVTVKRRSTSVDVPRRWRVLAWLVTWLATLSSWWVVVVRLLMVVGVGSYWRRW